MEEFRLGGAQSGLSFLCHMVSLIAVFSLRQGGTPKEMFERRKTQTKNWGKSLIVLMLHFVVSLQIEPEGSTVLFMVSGDLRNVANLRTLSSLERRSKMHLSNQALKDMQIVLDYVYLTLRRTIGFPTKTCEHSTSQISEQLSHQRAMITRTLRNEKQATLNCSHSEMSPGTKFVITYRNTA